MKRPIIFSVLIVLGMLSRAEDKQAYMVWDQRCIVLEKQPSTRVEAPMVNGEPDMKRVRLIGAKATLSTSCGHIEMRAQ
jgi:hypothetical protein